MENKKAVNGSRSSLLSGEVFASEGWIVRARKHSWLGVGRGDTSQSSGGAGNHGRHWPRHLGREEPEAPTCSHLLGSDGPASRHTWGGASRRAEERTRKQRGCACVPESTCVRVEGACSRARG